jgi:hypothetical protein
MSKVLKSDTIFIDTVRFFLGLDPMHVTTNEQRTKKKKQKQKNKSEREAVC